ncbi:AfsR/SARP family transcriptional regulator [Nonomuraea sediminis]|uniref:AfsR/SARP family transcriptional regulator n=1 Tax=Nonomuraea sediminis TaxID=2835864 RepID=UPI001BDBD00D|nr:AfsR/SARP family transcriptional regulator [Nonomuraea sediminis]
MTDWRIDLLGQVRVRDGAGEVPVGTPQQRAVLAMLALRAGEFVPIGDLVDGIFGEEPPRTAHTTISTYVTRLRGVLDRDRTGLLTSASGGYVLRVQPYQVDAHRLSALTSSAARAVAESRLAQALELYREGEALWRGEPLAGVAGPWADRQRSALAERRLAGLEARLAVELELGEHHAVVAELAGVAEAHPFRERLQSIRMLALYRAGRQGEALAVYQEVRRILADELAVDPGPELTELHAAILAADPSLNAPLSALATPKPAQLPAAIDGFTGRADLLADIVKALEETGSGAAPTLVAVCGMGGVGKTTFAVGAAHAVRHLFTDGQLYVDLRGAEAEPVRPAEALARFVTALGVPADAVPDGESERAGLFRSLLSDKRVLLVLDNARDLTQVRELLPGSPSCAVLITSRTMLASLPSARHVALDALTEAEARQMLVAILGAARVEAEEADAARLIELCGRLPLALRIAAARLTARPAWRLADMAERLADERGRLAELRSGSLAVEASFALSYEQATPAEADAFRLLAAPDAVELPLTACSAVLGLPPAQAEPLLESLVDVALLQSPAPGRYRLHDLVKLYARRRGADTEESAAARAALADFYIAALRSVVALLAPGDPVYAACGARTQVRQAAEPADAALWLQTEREAIVGALAGCAGDRLGDLLELVYTAGDRHIPADALRPHAARLAAHDRARAERVLGGLLLEEGRDAEAAAHLRRVVELPGVPGYLLCFALGELMVAETNLRNRAEARGLARRKLELAGSLGSVTHAVHGRTHLGALLDDPAQALEQCVRALAHARDERADPMVIAMIHADLAAIQCRAGQHEDAVESLTEAARLCPPDTVVRATIHYRMTEPHLALGRNDAALTQAYKALAVAQALSDEPRQAMALVALANVHRAEGEAPAAVRALTAAHAIFTRFGLAADAAEAEEACRSVMDAGIGR